MRNTEARARSGGLRHILRRFRTVPFRMLPAPFGQCVPVDLRLFEAKADEAQHWGRRALRKARVAHEHARPARQNEWLERQ